jgi:hypothetical protein
MQSNRAAAKLLRDIGVHDVAALAEEMGKPDLKAVE